MSIKLSYPNNLVSGNLTVNGRILVGSGSVTLPSISFINDSDTGFYNSVNTVSITLGGVQNMQFSSGLFLVNAVRSLSANQPLAVQGSTTSTGTAIGVKIGNSVALTTAGAKIVSFYSDNSTTERAAIGLTGEVMTGTGTSLLPSHSFLSEPDCGMYIAGTNILGFAVNGGLEIQLSAATLSPGVEDGCALGISSNEWSDLFLANGGIISWSNSDMAITHSADKLTFAGSTASNVGYSFSNNVIIGATTAGNLAVGTLCLSNGAIGPSASADLTHLYSADISASNSTLAIFTETATATDIALASTHSITVFINGSKFKIPLVSV